jgi:hypothetical protein
MFSAEMPSLESPALTEDERWKLVLRILASPGFQRAEQLRAMLKYLVAEYILHPERSIRESELAREVLGRGGDFDPAMDNIVRSQMSHLRRKLEAYYASEGRHETLRLSVPKGSYQPQFIEVEPEEAAAPTVRAAPSVAAPTEDLPGSGNRKNWVIAGLALACAVLAVLVAGLWLRERSAGVKAPASADTNEFVKFMIRRGGPVSVILPDTSLMLLQGVLATNITVPEYLEREFLAEQIARVPDEEVRNILLTLRNKRNTSSGESAAAVDVVSTLAINGMNATVRYSRDMRTRDLGEGNAIIMGSQRSNPWTTLFSDNLNFRFLQDTNGPSYSYRNLHPLPGEQPQYVPYVLQDGKYSSYVDIALCPNLTHSGYVVLVIGSDMQANEAAVRFLLHGALPASISGLFSRRDLSGRDQGVHEIFLQSRHAAGEAEESFDVVAVR